MKKTILFFCFITGIISTNAQETAKDTTKIWTKKGNTSMLFSQSAYNKQWLGGGV